ncbi:MAG: hypothetical protein WCJ02_07745 [bacterium]
MKGLMKIAIYISLAILLAVGGAGWWFERKKASMPEKTWFDEDPNCGELRLDMLLALQVGRSLRGDKQLPLFPEDKIATVKLPYFEINVKAPPDCDIGREQACWPEFLRPRVLYVDKATRVLIGGMSQTRSYPNKPELFREIMPFLELLGTKLGCTVTNMRHGDNRMAYDYVDPFGRERMLTLTSLGDGKTHWIELRMFDAKSCLADDQLNKIPQLQGIPPEELKAARKDVGLE